MSDVLTESASSILAAMPKIEDYANRRGYDEQFLGSKFKIPLPTFLKATKALIAEVKNARRAGVLDYTHFSMVINKARKFCFYGVVNIDGNSLQSLSKSHNWLIDPRVAESDQTGPEVYAGNDLDRGHMVRRLDPVWNGNGADFTVANRDTFHFTNACPQVHKFNDGIWGVLEDYLLKNADVKDCKLTVFTGPIFRDDDKVYRQVKVPHEFWKVAVMVSGAGSAAKLVSAGFILSQQDLLVPFDFPLGPIPMKVTQVPIKDIEQRTAMRFGKVTKADALAASFAPQGIAPKVRVIEDLDQIVINRRPPTPVEG